jgi:hypothetical protein
VKEKGIVRRILRAGASVETITEQIHRLANAYGGWRRLGEQLDPNTAAQVVIAAETAREREERELARLKAEARATADSLASNPATLAALHEVARRAGYQLVPIERRCCYSSARGACPQ